MTVLSCVYNVHIVLIKRVCADLFGGVCVSAGVCA